jgi:hypothetical protein
MCVMVCIRLERKTSNTEGTGTIYLYSIECAEGVNFDDATGNAANCDQLADFWFFVLHLGFLFEVFRIRESFPFAEKRLAQTHANTKKNRKIYFLAHAFILLTSPRNRIQCGSAGDSQTEKIFQKHLWKISTCDFRNQFCNFPPVRGRGMLLLI